MESQRGFTLVEVVAAVAILALLSAAVVAMSLAQRPGALRAATSGFDASLAAARALAATSGNGATMAFAPRTDGRGNALPGFTLTVYRGRPNAAGAVTPSTVPPLVGDADVRERSLGAPPFAIFLSSAGDPSGQGAYPQYDARGVATFAMLAAQPPCPAGGFVFTFFGAHATQARALPCAVSAVGTPMPLVTMTPSPVVLTPSSLVYDWPGAPRQSFVATEWGYTRWYSAQSFTCSAASFPQSDPSPPYSAAHSAADVTALPTPPSGVPISYANAPDSMQDAPARFYLDPAAGGTCNQAISDASRRYTRLNVQVMGQLTATPSTLAWTSAADRTQRSTMFGKTYDATGLDLSIVSNTCAGVVTFTWGSRSYPSIPGATASQERLYLTPVAGPDGANVGGTCAISVASQYAGEPPATVTVNVPSEMRTWPIAVKYAVNGGQLAYAPIHAHDFGAILNHLLGGGEALAANCTAIAYKDSALTQVDANDTSPVAGITTDASGCYGGQMVAYEPSGQVVTFTDGNGCGGSLILGMWSPSSRGPSAAIGASGGSSANAGCTATLSDGVQQSLSYGSGLVAVRVVAPQGPCSGNSGKDINYVMDWAYGETLDGHPVLDQGAGSGARGGSEALPGNPYASGSGPWAIPAAQIITITSVGGDGFTYYETSTVSGGEETQWSADFQYLVSDAAGGGSCTVEAQGAGRYDGDFDGGGLGGNESVDWSN